MSRYGVLSHTETLEHEPEGIHVDVTALCRSLIAIRLAHGVRHRPDHLGGSQVRATDEAI